jgi:hypothetical protein
MNIILPEQATEAVEFMAFIEGAGTLGFFDPGKREDRLSSAGGESVRTGNPPQGHVIVTKPREIHG